MSTHYENEGRLTVDGDFASGFLLAFLVSGHARVPAHVLDGGAAHL